MIIIKCDVPGCGNEIKVIATRQRKENNTGVQVGKSKHVCASCIIGLLKENG